MMDAAITTAGDDSDWMGAAYLKLKSCVDAAIEAVCSDKAPTSTADAEKLARAVGVIARAVKLVGALKTRVENTGDEDGMGGRNYDPEEDERLRKQLAADCDRLEQIIETKRHRQADVGGAAAGDTQSQAALPSGRARSG